MHISPEIRQAIAVVGRRHRLELVVLFGSHAAGRPREGSDVDVAVRWTKCPEEPDAFWRVADELEAAMGSGPIDLASLHGARPLLLNEVARSGDVLYEARLGSFPDFQRYAAARYRDEEHRARRIQRFLEERYGG